MDKKNLEGPTTRKIPVVTKADELQHAQTQYDEAVQNMLAKPNKDTIAAFEAANTKLFEIQDAYRIGARLLLMREKYISDTIHILRNAGRKGSQKTHTL